MNTKPDWVDRTDLHQIVSESKTVSQVLTRLGLVPKGGNYAVLRKWLKHLGISTEHFTQKGKFSKIYTDAEVFTKSSTVGSECAKLRYLGLKTTVYECSLCRVSSWLDNPITLELDHMDGNNTNHSLDNIRLLCPNCHSQTYNFRGRNKKDITVNPHGVRVCVDCGSYIDRKATRCLDCYHRQNRQTKIQWPEREQLAEMVKLTPLYILGPRLGVSSTAVKKRCKRLGIEIPGHRERRLDYLNQDDRSVG